MKSGSKLLIVAVVVSLSVLANAGIYMTVDGTDAAMQPFNTATSGELTFNLAGSAEIQQNKYDLTIVADGGMLQDLDASGQNGNPSNELNFKTSDLSGIGDIKFVFDEGTSAARINLVTNVNSNTVDFEYDLDNDFVDDCDLTTKVGNTAVTWDANGNMTDRVVLGF